MGEAGRSRKMVSRVAWRATLNEEESRAHLQARLRLLSGLMFSSFCAFLGFVAILYQFVPRLKPRLNDEILTAALSALAMLLALWIVLIRRRMSIAALNTIDVVYALGTGTMFASGAFFATDLPPAPYSCLLFSCLMVLTRAIIVPSSGRRTAAVATIASVPFVVAAVGLALTGWRDLPGPAVICSVILICSVVILLATTGSKTLYGLLRKASEATQLGQYTLDRKIGQGGMGVVYRAHHVLLRRPTAVKLLLPDQIGAETIDRFEREVRHMSELTHPNTVAVFDYGRSADGVFYYAMEYLDGIDLQRLVTTHGPQPADRVIAILVQVCGALQEAHGVGLIHRDIKPANIILCERGGMPDVAKVVDYGLVKNLETDQDVSGQIVLGTPGYVAPELLTSPDAVGRTADLYALGCVGYFLLTGRRVFEADSSIQLTVQHLTRAPVAPSKVAAIHIPDALDQIILQCLAKAPGDRPASAAALARLLRAVPPCRDWDEVKAFAWWVEFRTIDTPPDPASSLPGSITIDLGERMVEAESDDELDLTG